MKKLLVTLFLLAMLAVPSTALAWTQQDAYSLDEAGWSLLSQDDSMAKARVWTEGADNGSCDQLHWEINLTNHVTVTQWIQWSIDAKNWNWQVRKPGVFAGDCIGLYVKSNDDVNIAFSDFTELVPQIHTGALGSDDWAPAIKVAYRTSTAAPQGLDDDEGWLYVTPLADTTGVNGYVIPIKYSTMVRFRNDEPVDCVEWMTKLWNRISIPCFQRACDYEGSGKITISTTDTKYFVDGLLRGGPYGVNSDGSKIRPDQNPLFD